MKNLQGKVQTRSEPAQTTPNPPTEGGGTEKKGPIAVLRGSERALLVVKGRIGWRKRRIRVERAT